MRVKYRPGFLISQSGISEAVAVAVDVAVAVAGSYGEVFQSGFNEAVK